MWHQIRPSATSNARASEIMPRTEKIEKQSPWLVILRKELEDAVIKHEAGWFTDDEFMKKLVDLARRAKEL